jgi:hypothetical protein
MDKVDDIEMQVKALSSAELAQFREWFAEFDAQLWDNQFEADVQAGKLKGLAEEALQEYAAGRTTEL